VGVPAVSAPDAPSPASSLSFVSSSFSASPSSSMAGGLKNFFS